MRKHWIVIALVASLCFAALGASAASAQDAASSTSESSVTSGVTPLDEACATGNVCYWSGTGYSGSKSYVSCTGGDHSLSFEAYSMKNRCPNKASFLRQNGYRNNCINANNQTTSTEVFDEIDIGDEGSTC